MQNKVNRYNSILILLLVAATLLTVVSCKKSSNTATTGTFYFHIHSNIDTNEVADTATLYSDASGRHIRLNVAQFYISGIKLHNVNGSTYSFPDTYILKTLQEEEDLIGTAPAGTYDYATFSIGLDPAANAVLPANQPESSILHNPPGMLFGGTGQGYIFMKLQGLADTTAAQAGTNLVHFSYYIGANSNLKTISMPVRSGSVVPYILAAGGTQYVHLTCDFGKLLSVVDFKTQDSTDTYTINPTVATAIADKTTDIFGYEE